MRKKALPNPFTVFLLILSAIFLSQCKQEQFSNIQQEEVNIEIIRFEQELFNIDLYSFQDSAKYLNLKYPDFLPLFGNKIIEIGDPSQHWFYMGLKTFVTDQAIYSLNKRVSEIYPNMSDTEEQLKKAFGKWAALFPEKNIPDIYTYVSGFNQSIVTAEGILGISLEKYLGTNENLYNEVYPPLPAYQRYVMTPDRLPCDIIRAWAFSETPYKPEQDNLLSQMIHHGQVMYLSRKLLSDMHDTLLWGFTPAQLDFCKKNEKQMWTFLIEQKLLFTTENFRISQFIEERPFTKDFQHESPGRAAVWIGYRIIEQYVHNNKNLSLNEVVSETNYQKILSQSKYRPKS